jgi:CubicO group peptidase (beta-lactamase class C family)
MAGLRVRQLVPSQVALVTPSQRTRNQPTRRPDASSIIRSRKYEIPGTATHETSTAGRHHPLPRCEHSSLDRRGGTGQGLTRTVRQYARAHAFSGTVLVQKRGKLLFQESFGPADRAFNVPITDSTKFRVASITKSFTAVLILQLVEQGRLDPRAPIRLTCRTTRARAPTRSAFTTC